MVCLLTEEKWLNRKVNCMLVYLCTCGVVLIRLLIFFNFLFENYRKDLQDWLLYVCSNWIIVTQFSIKSTGVRSRRSLLDLALQNAVAYFLSCIIDRNTIYSMFESQGNEKILFIYILLNSSFVLAGSTKLSN